MSADAKAGLQLLLGHALLGGEHAPAQDAAAGNHSAEPLYEARFDAQRASVPVRPALTDEHGALLHPKPTVWGTQTALVVGLDGPIHTDRDGRVKVQFHWQRGAGSSHRLNHPASDNAPASDASGIPGTRTTFSDALQEIVRTIDPHFIAMGPTGQVDQLAMNGAFGAWYEAVLPTLMEEPVRGHVALASSDPGYILLRDGPQKDHPLYASTGEGFYRDVT